MLKQEQEKMKLMNTDGPVGDKADYERYICAYSYNHKLSLFAFQ